MTLAIILLIILAGLVLIFLEVFLIPGTTLVGLLGGVALLVGIVLMYTTYGGKWGNVSLGISVVAVLISVYAGFRTVESNKLAMKGEITGKVNELEKGVYNIGDVGLASSELRPNGKAVFNGNKIEVYSTGEYIERDTKLEITKITNDKIFVKPLKT